MSGRCINLSNFLKKTQVSVDFYCMFHIMYVTMKLNLVTM